MPESEWETKKKNDCPHLSENKNSKSDKTECEKCGETKHLRICLTCGFVACCESAKGHNTEHFRQSKHALIRPHRCGYDWLWCYRCNAFLE